MIDPKTLSHENLLKLAEVFAKNWLAHDGCWFLAAEEKYNLDIAIDLDTRSWKRFAAAEARRIKSTFRLSESGGLKALDDSFSYRLYSMINKQETEWLDQDTLIFRMLECRVQKARRRKNLPDFPCKPVGIVEFSTFAKTIDERISTECIQCPPDDTGNIYCVWKFTCK